MKNGHLTLLYDWMAKKNTAVVVFEWHGYLRIIHLRSKTWLWFACFDTLMELGGGSAYLLC